MKVKNIIIRTFVVVFLLNLVGCNEEFLERQPLDKFTEKDVFSTEESLETFVNRIYNQQYTVGTLDWWWKMTFELFYSPLTDESHGKFDFWHFKEVISGGLTPDNMGVFVNKWRIGYQGIRNCNLFFKNIHLSEEAGVSPEAIARLSDEVRLLRAIIYHDLLKHFGGVPIADQVYDLNNVEIIPRNDKLFFQTKAIVPIVSVTSKAATPGRSSTTSGAELCSLKIGAFPALRLVSGWISPRARMRYAVMLQASSSPSDPGFHQGMVS